MAYDIKYIKEGNDVGDYLNDREDAIEGAFESFIDSGSNTNGSWIKFPDGTMICYYAHGRNRYNWSVEAGKYNHLDVNLPQSFVGNYTVEIHGIPHNENAIPMQAIIVAEMLESDVFRMRGIAIQGFDFIRGFGYTAIGRWK